jgi:2-polyprenyl-6-methoxyphenol hydroxylase-like FAD-dependent oxidoreductase
VRGLHLANLGVPFMIFEDDGGLSTEPKAGVLLPSSLEILSQLGVAEQILGEGVRCGTVEFLDGVSARVVNRMHLHELHTDTRYPMGLPRPTSPSGYSSTGCAPFRSEA